MNKSSELESLNAVGSYQYSAVGLDHLAATEYTIVTILCDTSSSVTKFKDGMEKCLQEIIKSCRRSPRADNLMLRLVMFNSHESEYHGFRLLSECNPDDYNGCLNVGGSTLLFDTTYNSIVAAKDYGISLVVNDFDTNGILFIITDGEDNVSSYTPSKIKEEIESIQMSESLESFISVLIGVNIKNDKVRNALESFKDKAELTQYIELGDASEKTLAKVAAFVSRSISSQSTSIGSGQASDQTSLTI